MNDPSNEDAAVSILRFFQNRYARRHFNPTNNSTAAIVLNLLQNPIQGTDDKIKTRISRRRQNQDASPWAIMLEDGYCKDPSTIEGRLFRRRFRVPYPLFEKILEMVKEEKWFPKNSSGM